MVEKTKKKWTLYSKYINRENFFQDLKFECVYIFVIFTMLSSYVPFLKSNYRYSGHRLKNVLDLISIRPVWRKPF